MVRLHTAVIVALLTVEASACGLGATRWSAPTARGISAQQRVPTVRPRGDIQLRVQRGRIAGRLVDQSGAAVANVTITVTSTEDNAVSFTAVSNATGGFSVSVPPGSYRLSARSGVMSGASPTISVAAGGTQNVTLTLRRATARAMPPPPPPPPPPPTPPPPTPPPPTPPPPPPTVIERPRPPTSARPPATTTRLPDLPVPPVVPPVPPTVPTTTKAMQVKVGQSAFWNSWVTADGEVEPIASVKAGARYVVSFDLSPFAYESSNVAGAASAIPDPTFQDELARVTALLRIRAQAVVAGTGLNLASGFDPALRTSFTVQTLRTVPSPRGAQEPFAEFEQRVRAGRLDVEVEAESPGCAAVGLSIWTDSNKPRPLDYLSRRITVLDANGVPPSCATSLPPASTPMTTQLLSLLSAEDGAQPDIALHIFELDLGSAVQRVSSQAVFVAAQPDGPVSLAWPLAEDVSAFVTDQNSLLKNVAAAHNGKGYEPLMAALTRSLFPEDETAARDALRLLREIAPHEPRPTVFARLVDLTGTARLLPLGLIDAGGGRPLGELANIIEPLPQEERTQPTPCVQAWTMVLPEALTQYASQTCSARPSTTSIRQWAEFARYLSPAQQPSASEGLLLLAHQATGTLSFDNSATNTNWADTTQLKRQYPPGSVAMMVACNAGADANQYGERSWLTHLNAAGVDAEIVSPFEVSSDFGVCLASHFANSIEEARQSSRETPLIDLFREASGRVKADYSRSPSAEERARANGIYEFVLAGNGQLTICPR